MWSRTFAWVAVTALSLPRLAGAEDKTTQGPSQLVKREFLRSYRLVQPNSEAAYRVETRSTVLGPTKNSEFEGTFKGHDGTFVVRSRMETGSELHSSMLYASIEEEGREKERLEYSSGPATPFTEQLGKPTEWVFAHQTIRIGGQVLELSELHTDEVLAGKLTKKQRDAVIEAIPEKLKVFLEAYVGALDLMPEQPEPVRLLARLGAPGIRSEGAKRGWYLDNEKTWKREEPVPVRDAPPPPPEGSTVKRVKVP